MRHGSLFSGIGGFDLAAEWMGWENVFHCEWEDFPRKVLKYYWPKAISYGDITKTDFTIHRGDIDIITGGFPCQPYSAAGNRKGTADERHLWPEMLRAIREVEPSYVVGENVRGLVNWNDGLVFDEIIADLEALGYEVQPFLLPAVAVGAPHRRDRIWFVAYATSGGRKAGAEQPRQACNNGGLDNIRLGNYGRSEQAGLCGIQGSSPDTQRSSSEGQCQCGQGQRQPGGCNSGDAANTSHQRLQGCKVNGSTGSVRAQRNEQPARCVPPTWQNFPTVSPVRSNYDGVSEAMVRNIKSEIYGQISEKYTDKDLQEVWSILQQKEVQEQIGRLYKIHEPRVLLQTVQLCATPNSEQGGGSAFSEKTSEDILRRMRKHGGLANTPQGRELEKQFKEQFGDTLPYLSHEIALVTMEAQRASKKFISWHRNESIKAYGNAIVPQVALQIFKAIELWNRTIH